MLILGPIVGHTSHAETRIWIQAGDDPSGWRLRVQDGGEAPFTTTESGEREFGTALAVLGGLQPDRRYAYQVLHAGETAAGGSFRTMPPPGSDTELVFASASCDSLTVGGDQPRRGAWDLLEQAIDRERPRLLVMLGDQIYLDEEAPDIWEMPLDLERRERRRRMAAKYRSLWSRQPVARILANLPSVMMWDDHDVREGWGSNPGDSPTLAARHPAGRPIAAQYNSYFEDARALAWHFQMVRNPPTPGVGAQEFLEPGSRRAVPFRLDIGRSVVLVLDNRGARDEWRGRHPAFGDAQWRWLHGQLDGLGPEVDSLVIVVPLPVVSMANHGPVQIFLGHRRDDVRLFARGDAEGLRRFGSNQPSTVLDRGLQVVDALRDFLVEYFWRSGGSGKFLLGDVTDVRDNWANHHVRRERDALVRAALRARDSRPGPVARAVGFIGGDLHVGALIDIVTRAGVRLPTMITSGIGQSPAAEPVRGTVLQTGFRIAGNLHAHMRGHCVEHNFGLTWITRDGDGVTLRNRVEVVPDTR